VPFQNIKGHDSIIHSLKKALKSSRVSHAYLFYGPEGIGKSVTAHTFSKALNCLKSKTDACDECASCKKIENNNHPDVVWLKVKEKKEAISIEQIRELQNRINYKPYEGRAKVFCIQDSHLMTLEAANCLLKTLEEPPNDSQIILITSQIEGLLPTIKSRCAQIKFEPLGLELKVKLMEAQGFLGQEARFLSRLITSGVSIPEEEVFPHKGEFFDYKNKVVEQFSFDGKLLDEKSFVFNGTKENTKFMMSVMESWLRDILILKSGGDQSVVINSDRMSELNSLKDKVSFCDLEKALKEVINTQFAIDRNVGSKLTLNDLKLKLGKIKPR